MASEPYLEEAAGKCVDAHGGAIGMPQLCIDWMPNQIFWLAVSLVVLFVIQVFASDAGDSDTGSAPVADGADTALPAH